jgi:hypothetical protein
LDTCVGTGMTTIYSTLLVRVKIISQFFPRNVCFAKCMAGKSREAFGAKATEFASGLTPVGTIYA